MLGAFVSARALEGGIEPVPAIIDWPDRQPIGYRASLVWETLG
jgi:hypothetical protein